MALRRSRGLRRHIRGAAIDAEEASVASEGLERAPACSKVSGPSRELYPHNTGCGDFLRPAKGAGFSWSAKTVIIFRQSDTLRLSVIKTGPHVSNDAAASRQATTAGVVVLGLLKALARARVEPAPLCRAVGLDVGSLEAPDARVSTGLVARLLALAEQRARELRTDCGARNASAGFSSTRFG